jgi:deazaflavin-dependent oxidoreductase (nitroreductase family)
MSPDECQKASRLCDSRPMSERYRLGLVRRLVNVLMKALLRLGIAGGHTYLLSVPGRKSGRTYSTPVIVLEDGERWLVGPYGEVSWVRNVRAAGRATLSRGRHHEEVEVSEVGSPESAPVLREYLRQVRVVRPFFDASPDSPLDAFAAEAGRHPVFRIESVSS